MSLEESFQPQLTWLSESNKEQLFQAALTVLSDIGMQVQHDEALDLLQSVGCGILENQMVSMPAALIKNAIGLAPSSIPVYDRTGRLAMDLGGRRSYFGTGSDLIYSLDSATMSRHQCVLEDVKRAARVCDSLPNIDFIMSSPIRMISHQRLPIWRNSGQCFKIPSNRSCLHRNAGMTWQPSGISPASFGAVLKNWPGSPI